MSFGWLNVYSYGDLRHLLADVILEVLGEIMCLLYGEIGVYSEVQFRKNLVAAFASLHIMIVDEPGPVVFQDVFNFCLLKLIFYCCEFLPSCCCRGP